ncbi:MAG: glutamate--tRNA ligase [Candidatus Paceibacterota bacterium]
MNTDNKKIVTRFAPSPTGFMHVGNVRTALFAYLWAKRNNGTFILRIEDTDKEREVSGSIEHIFESLKWLGIDWDEGPGIDGPHAPYIQSQRLDLYKKYAMKLLEKGLAYPDPYTEEEVAVFRQKAEEEKRPFLYREHRPDHDKEWDGRAPLRFKVPNIKRYEWYDLVFGDLSAGEEALDDIILIKGDGYPTYNFAHIVDDIEMGVTHVMRGQEFISSTPKFLSIYEGLDIVPPIFATLPPIMATGGNKKLGKRDGAKDILDYRKEGYLPETMVNFLAFLGWNPGDDREVMSASEIANEFDISRIQKSGAQFNDEKLDWLNKEYLKKLSYEDQEEYILKFIPESIKGLPGFSNEIVHNITPVVIDRVSKGLDVETMALAGELVYYFGKPVYEKDVLFFKSSKIPQENKYEILASYLDKSIIIVDGILEENFNKDFIKESIWPYAEEVGRGDILWPIRYALSGRDKSPDPFMLMEILGKKETIERLKSAIQILTK